MTRPSKPAETFDSAFSDDKVPAALRERFNSSYTVAGGYWTTAMTAPHLSARIKELVVLALHASASALNSEAVTRHVQRAREAGATEADILDVLLSIVGLANHALYFALPLLVDELQSAGGPAASLPELRPDIAAVKADFIRTRGFWTEERDLLARFMPDYFVALSAASVEPWRTGSLSTRERELIFIAIDASVTHMYAPGLRLHIRNALKAGATRNEILEVFHLVALMGLEGYILGASALLGS
jgi:alkylhydroperoxidase/carboxymuconolactone decarboxylase family protein YurZ